MPDWLPRFYTAAALIDARPLTAEEMPEHVFEALVEGRIGEIDLEEIDDTVPIEEPEISFAETRPGLAQRPLRALALARLCRALPLAEDLARWLAPGTITVIACRPAGLAGDLAIVLAQLIEAEHPTRKLNLVCSSGRAHAPETKPLDAVAGFWKDALAEGRGAHLLILGDAAQLPRRMARLLPPVLQLGPPDREVVAAALSLGDPGPLTGDCALPPDAALARLGADAWRLALRLPDLAGRAAELRRLTEVAAAGTKEAGPVLEDLCLDGPVAAAARRLVADIAAWRAGRIAWSQMTRSLLIHGEPGTGKTWLARAVAGSAGLPLVTASLAEWQAAGHLGDMLREMRAAFARARSAAPCVLILDELDAAGSRASGDRHAVSYRAQVIAGLLQELDGVLGLEGVLVLATTNDARAIDPALLRPGRIDRVLALPRPSPAAVRAILARLVAALPVTLPGASIGGADLDRLSRRATGRSPAELDAALREAQSRAREAGRPVAAADIAAALGFGREDPAVLRRVAVHEAGHAVMLHHTGRGRITGARIGMGGGHVAVEDLPLLDTRAGLEDQLACCLAGRAAEELILGAPTTGAGGGAASDLGRATQLAAEIERGYGLGAGLLWQADPGAALATDPALAARVEAHLQRALRRARATLIAERPRLEALTARLLAERVIEGDPFAAPRTAPADPRWGAGAGADAAAVTAPAAGSPTHPASTEARHGGA
ncbi:AAA family ATPase [Paracoccus tibetensis]|uniref:Peptidase family M41 n=1 Tax=Paracoccus tibetensis TaxID=336292 RepID=A0A1G5JHG7_9RHOB|nr:AAA family ATPase [Paracoccus tibetensis]SCY87785.1 Peptidase family M41 [Paracoccus tibetensis]